SRPNCEIHFWPPPGTQPTQNAAAPDSPRFFFLTTTLPFAYDSCLRDSLFCEREEGESKMIRIEGIPIVAARLAEARNAKAVKPRQRTPSRLAAGHKVQVSVRSSSRAKSNTA